MSQDSPRDITEFAAELRRQDVAPKTVEGYTSDLAGFARWVADGTGDAFAARAVPVPLEVLPPP